MKRTFAILIASLLMVAVIGVMASTAFADNPPNGYPQKVAYKHCKPHC